MLGAMRARMLVLLSCLLACDPAGGLLVRHTVRLDAATPPDQTDGARDADLRDADLRDADLRDAAAMMDAGLDAAIDAGPRDPGTLVGSGLTGYYYAALQSDFPTGAAAPIINTSCGILIPGGLTEGLADAICIEGVGKLSDGRVLQFAAICSQCTNAHLCPANVRGCFYFEDQNQAPWGRGRSGRALVPLRSIAIDPDGPLADKVLYLPALDGVSLAASPSSAAFIHDGCVRADDTGELTNLLGFRLFTGDETQYLALNAQLPGDSATPLYENAPHCQSPTP